MEVALQGLQHDFAVHFSDKVSVQMIKYLECLPSETLKAFLEVCVKKKWTAADAEMLSVLANLFRSLPNSEGAALTYSLIICIGKATDSTHCCLSIVVNGRSRLRALEEGLRVFPQSALLHATMGTSLIELREFHNIALIQDFLRTAISLTCDRNLLSPIWMNLALLESHLGHLDQAVHHLFRAIKVFPENHLPWLNMAVEMLYAPKPRVQASIVAEHLFTKDVLTGHPVYDIHQAITDILYGEVATPPFPTLPANSPTRVGFVCGDFFDHPVANFTRHLYSKNAKNGIEHYLYSTTSVSPERVSKELPSCDWRCVDGLSTDAIVDLVQKDSISVLIDLAGFTKGGRLDVFARRPAKHMLSYCGCPCDLGMKHVKRVSDQYTEMFTTGELSATVRLPRLFLAYSPLGQMFPSRRTRSAGKIVLGCYAKLQKINNLVINAWKQILCRLPHATLLLKGMQFLDPVIKREWLDKFSPYDKQVLLNEADLSHADHIESFANIDIHLDTFPYSGTTISVEALLSNVPVVTLSSKKKGTEHVSRVTGAILTSIGLSDLCVAGTVREYVDKVVKLAVLPEPELPKFRELTLKSPVLDTDDMKVTFDDMLLALVKEN